MRRFTLFVLLLALMASAAITVSAQDTTPTVTPTVEQTLDPTFEPTTSPNIVQPTPEFTASLDSGSTVQAVPIRFAHFASDAPALITYVNGQPGTIQDLTFGAISGWVELPVGTTLALVPQGAALSQAVVGPITVDARSSWVTIIVVGSAQAGTLQGYAVRENVTFIPENCALVTIINGIEGSQAFDLTGNDGVMLAASVGFPGTLTGANISPNQAPAANDPCAQTAVTDMNSYGAATCTALSGGDPTFVVEDTATQDAMSTDEPDTMTGDFGAISEGAAYANCAYTFLVPAGGVNLIANAAGGGGVIFTLEGTQFSPNTYYLLVILGSEDAPQVISYAIEGDRLAGVLANQSDAPEMMDDPAVTETPAGG